MSSYLSREIQQIKKNARWGLLNVTDHALYRLKQRNMNEQYILDMLQKKDTTIVQYHDVNTYHNNPDELFVCYAKDTCGKDSRPLHIVSAKKECKYTIVTCYVPNNKLFYAYGRYLRT